MRPGQEDIAVDWQISERSGATKAVNLIIEGVSMLANERAEVGAMLEAKRGSVDGLIARCSRLSAARPGRSTCGPWQSLLSSVTVAAPLSGA